MVINRGVVRIAVALLAAHVLVLAVWGQRPPGPLLSDLIQSALAATTIGACLLAMRRGGSFARWFWSLAAFAFSIFTLAQLIATYTDLQNAPLSQLYVSDVLFFFWVTPIGMALFLNAEPESEGFDPLLLLDFAQVIILFLVAYLYFFYVPSHSGAGWQAKHSAWRLHYLPYGVLTAAYLLRGFRSGPEAASKLFRRMGAYLFIGMVGDYLFEKMVSLEAPSGGWFDLAWSTQLLLPILIAATWRGSETARAVAPRRVERPSLALAQLLPVAFPFFVLVLSAQIAQEQLKVAWVGVIASFACSGARVLLTQQRERRSVQALAESELRYRGLFERNLAGVFRCTPEGVILHCNDAFRQIFGYEDAAELKQQSFAALFADPAFGENYLSRLRREPHLNDVEAYLRNKAGQQVWVLENISMINEPNGPVIEGTLVDISARKQSEIELRGWKRRYETAVKASGQIIYDWDPASKFLTLEGSLQSMLGYSDGEIRGLQTRWRELIHPDDLERYQRALDAAISRKDSFQVEYRLKRKDGAYRAVRDQGRVLTTSFGNLVNVVGFITEDEPMSSQVGTGAS